MKSWLINPAALPHAAPPGAIAEGGLWSLLLWLGVSLLTAAVGVLLFTRWRPWRPLKKCLVVSLLLHLWMVLGLSAVSIPRAVAPKGPQELCITLEDTLPEAQRGRHEPPGKTTRGGGSLALGVAGVAPVPPPAEPKPHLAPLGTALVETRQQATSEASQPWRETAAREPPQAAGPPGPRLVQPAALVPQLTNRPENAEPALATAGPTDQWPRRPAQPAESGSITTGPPAQPLPSTDTAVPVSAEAAEESRPPDTPGRSTHKGLEPLSTTVARETPGHGSRADPGQSASQSDAEGGRHSIPAPYSWRIAPDRSEVARRFGASEESEKAVDRALDWLAGNQDPDGRWNPRHHGAGDERFELGRDRQGAGTRADTGITGLALLAFAGRGNTHRRGPYAATVQKGVKFLLDVQAPDGNLAGQAAPYEFMYCHGIATLALSEIVGLSGDAQLRGPLASAVAYTVASQDPWGGGWRYRPAEPGDTSQLGWQLLALRSAELAGIAVPRSTWEGAARYLATVSAGTHGGLAAYRPGERATRTMTAEALVCRQLLGLWPTHPAAREAGDYLLGELPGEGAPNRYYWYYATMAMYQLQGTHWELWNRALQRTLLATQRRDAPFAGSWDPTTRWDGYGGRVYATALATLCLEAYYRFMPPTGADRPGQSPAVH